MTMLILDACGGSYEIMRTWVSAVRVCPISLASIRRIHNQRIMVWDMDRPVFAEIGQ
jgi:hypothetical protein